MAATGTKPTRDIVEVAEIRDGVMVLKDGRVCEAGPREEVFGNPKHPYTQALFSKLLANPTD